ncbi:hypothetical protein SNEBB_003296 [Seison nebaliae]|nr:hypothetical protein SNEBB_003296 [Seison nebaliae]
MEQSNSSLNLRDDVKKACDLLEKLKGCNDLPKEKLQALQDVFESDLFQLVRNVYEEIYSSVEVPENTSTSDRAIATARATVAAFAASEGKAPPRVVVLIKGNEGFGFNIIGGKEQNCPIFISRIMKGGVAARHGGLRTGDQLLNVDSYNVEEETHAKTVQLLKQATEKIRLVVRYAPRQLRELEQKFLLEKSGNNSSAPTNNQETTTNNQSSTNNQITTIIPA